MFGARTLKSQAPSQYATRGDFCRIFETDMNRLYRLSFLLTADEAIAEHCFVGGLHIAQGGNPVFKEWADSWARRAIILNAIRMIRPRLTAERTDFFGPTVTDPVMERDEIAEIVKLPDFERFAFVMTVLEGYSDHECALHLSCTRSDVTAARTRALEQLGKAAEHHRKLVNIASAKQQRREDRDSEVHSPVLSSTMVASA